jgi:hypothetical protein
LKIQQPVFFSSWQVLLLSLLLMMLFRHPQLGPQLRPNPSRSYDDKSPRCFNLPSRGSQFG